MACGSVMTDMTMPSRYGLPDCQYWVFFVSVSESLFFHSTNLNGPVPTAFVGSLAAVGSAILRNSKKSNASGRGLSDLKMTVYLSGVSIEVHHLASSSWVLGKSRARSLLNFTALESSSAPLWNWTPLRRLNLIVVESEETSQL